MSLSLNQIIHLQSLCRLKWCERSATNKPKANSKKRRKKNQREDAIKPPNLCLAISCTREHSARAAFLSSFHMNIMWARINERTVYTPHSELSANDYEVEWNILRDTKNTVTITCYTLHNRFRLLLFLLLANAGERWMWYEESRTWNEFRMWDDPYIWQDFSLFLYFVCAVDFFFVFFFFSLSSVLFDFDYSVSIFSVGLAAACIMGGFQQFTHLFHECAVKMMTSVRYYFGICFSQRKEIHVIVVIVIMISYVHTHTLIITQ